MDKIDLEQIYVNTPNHWNWESEMLWARKNGENLYEIMSIPYAAYGLNKGDIVETTDCADKKMPRVEHIHSSGGHHTVRIIFLNRLMPVEERDLLVEEMKKEFQFEYERVNDNYITIDIIGRAAHEKLCEALVKLQDGGIIAYETCEARVEGSFGDIESDQNNSGAIL